VADRGVDDGRGDGAREHERPDRPVVVGRLDSQLDLDRM